MAYTTINKPTVYFDTRLYTGTGAENVVSDLGFNPDFAWFKKRSAAEHHFLYDQVRGALKKIATSNTNAEFTETQTLKSFGTNGYTLGTSAEVNGSATTYAAWNWKAGTTSGLSGWNYYANFVQYKCSNRFWNCTNILEQVVREQLVMD